MRKIYFWALIVSVLGFTACEGVGNIIENMEEMGTTDQKADSSFAKLLDSGCPQVEIVGELASISDFSNPSRPTKENLISRVQITDSQSNCEYTTKSVTVDLKLTFDGILGDKARMNAGDKPFFTYPFFIAVLSPNGQILAKEVFGASMTYDSNQDRQLYYESLRQVIPIKSKRRGAKHKIMVGFQLSPDQLSYNRALLQDVQTMQMPAATKPSMQNSNEPMQLAPTNP